METWVRQHIERKKMELIDMRIFLQLIDLYREDMGLSSDTIYTLKAKISSKIAQCERSIIDHEKER